MRSPRPPWPVPRRRGRIRQAASCGLLNLLLFRGLHVLLAQFSILILSPAPFSPIFFQTGALIASSETAARDHCQPRMEEVQTTARAVTALVQTRLYSIYFPSSVTAPVKVTWIRGKKRTTKMIFCQLSRYTEATC